MSKKGRQINLDNGEGNVLDGFIVDDVCSPCSWLDITFETSEKLLFGADADYYFTYVDIDWVPFSFTETVSVNKTWHYEMSCYPKAVFALIEKPLKNTIELARVLGLNLAPTSLNLELCCPTIHEFAGNFVQDNRHFSFEKNFIRDKLGDTTYMYVGGKQLYSSTWKSMCSKQALSLEFPKETAGSNLISYQDYQFNSVFHTVHEPIAWKQNDFIEKMIGVQFKIETTIPAFFLNVYTIKIEDIPEFDTGLPFLCTYSKRSITEVNAFVHCFSNIKYI